MKLSVSLAVALLMASHTFAGMTITTSMKTEGPKKGGEKPAVSRVKVEGESARMEWIEGGNPSVPAKGYIVTRDGGKTLYMVNPEEKTYMKWDMAAMGKLAAGFMETKVKEYKVEKILEEDGPAILGYPTRHYKFLTTFSMEMTIMGMKQSSSGKTEHEYWTTTKIKPEAMAAFEKIAMQSAAGMGGDLQKIIDAEKAKSMKGFPLKTVTTTDSGTPGKPQITKNIMEITEIKDGRVAASEFEMPKDYKELNLSEAAEGAAEEASGTEKTDKPAKPAKPVKGPSGLDGFMKNLGDKLNKM